MSADPFSTLLGSIRAREVLDVGCGTGTFTRILADSLAQWDAILGIDPDKDSVDEARRRTDLRGIRYRIMSAPDTPFHDRRFGLVCISNSLHHLEEPEVVLREMIRVARSDGLLVVQELVGDRLTAAEENERDVHHLKAAIDRLNGRCHRPTYAREEVRSLLNGAGLEVVAETEVTDDEPGSPESPRVREVLGFLGEYLEFVKDEPDCAVFQTEASRIGRRLVRDGIATPPRLLMVLRHRA